MAIMTFLFCFLTYETILKYASDQTLIKISKQTYWVRDIPFPAVTFCPEPLISRLKSLDPENFIGNLTDDK